MKDGAGGQLDLTTPIKAFTDIVMRSAIQINVWKTGIFYIVPHLIFIHYYFRGMKIVADYKKRKELKEYLPHDEHWKLKSQDRKPSTAILSELNTTSDSPSAKQLSTQTSEERKRSIAEEEQSPPKKKCNVDNENEDVISEEVENNMTTTETNGNGAAA